MWQYDLFPNQRQAVIVDREGYTVADVSAPAHTTAATNFPDTLAMMTAAPALLAALRAMLAKHDERAPLSDLWPTEARAARAASERA
jgi:acyl-CoA reductase-like NAD-dependent aldehyde dehydrogenase